MKSKRCTTSVACRSRKLAYHHRVRRELQPKAKRNWRRWTLMEIQIALDWSRPARQIAKELKRTSRGVERIRRVYRRKKK